MTVEIDLTGRKPITDAESRLLASAPSLHTGRVSFAEARRAVEWGWPATVVVIAIAESEASTAEGIDHWLGTRGYVSWWRAREEPEMTDAQRAAYAADLDAAIDVLKSRGLYPTGS